MTRVAVMQMKTDDQNPDRNIETIIKLLEETFQNNDTEKAEICRGKAARFAAQGSKSLPLVASSTRSEGIQ